MTNVKLKCPKCGEENSIDIFKAKEGSRILCKSCKNFIILNFQDGITPDKIKKDLINKLKKSLPREIKIKL